MFVSFQQVSQNEDEEDERRMREIKINERNITIVAHYPVRAITETENKCSALNREQRNEGESERKSKLDVRKKNSVGLSPLFFLGVLFRLERVAFSVPCRAFP